MAKCKICGTDEALYFVCTYCKGIFCSNHRLPESHNCPEMLNIKTSRTRYVHSPPQARKRSFKVQGLLSMEITHLLVALFILGFCFSFRYIYDSIFPILFIISTGTVGAGFALHELTHKFSAQRYGFWAEFRLWPTGLIMALILTVVSGGNLIFAAPGATYIAPRNYAPLHSEGISRRQNGIISLAGPLSNVALAIVFLMLSNLQGWFAIVGTIGFQTNLWLAAFNMIPFGGIDGRKVLSWKSLIWAIVAIPLWILVAILLMG
jgi:Zn-dependent protease